MNNEHLQRLLPFGYIYLVIMGIIKESIFYYQLDINILKFSSIMDILISPIAEITAHSFLLIFFILLIFLLYGFKQYSLKHSEKKFIKKFLKKYFKIDESKVLTHTEFEKIIDKTLINYFFALLICFFLGFGIGGGNFLSKRIKNGDLKFEKYGQTLTFNSGEKKEIYLVNTNSLYYFYVVKGQKTVEISPIGTIQSIAKNK
ncbi:MULTISPECIES: hypothetical protein [unclassified Empedobacter]|uniref:hypothetical protein n=1 Tax=unclassified Empedobacter TaxID=2643773 RepID=UPI0025C355C4|nr:MULTISPECIES: hypothetical protein [unclassified Empedobacter]